MHFRRIAVEDCEMQGCTIATGDRVILWFIFGNFDERVFDNPYNVDFARDPNSQIALGRGGPHLCLGLWLARLELRIVLEELTRRLRTIRPAGQALRLRSNFINGIKYPPVSVTC